MSIPWEESKLTAPESALVTDIEGVACTLIMHGDTMHLAWSVGITGKDAILPNAEAIIADVSRIIVVYLRREWSGE